MKHNTKKLEKSQIEVEFELDEAEFTKYIDKALDHLKSHMKMDGFRPGNIPKEMVEKKIGQEDLLMEAGELAVKENYTKFVKENNLEPIGQPDVQILKIAKGSPFLFKVKVAILPEIELPDYKKIALQIKSNEVSVDEKEVEDAINYLQKSRAKFSQVNRGAEIKDFVEIEYQNENINGGKSIKDMFILGEGGFLKDFEDNILGMRVGDEKEFSAKFPENAPDGLGGKEGKFKVKMLLVQTMELPEINDEFAKGLGVFDSLVSLKKNIREGITLEKKEGEKQRKRGEILNKIAENINFELPQSMVEYEQKRLFESLKNQVAKNFKISFEEYLTSVKKTEDGIKQSYEKEAEKRIKDYLVLREIGKKENIEVPDQELEEETNKMIASYPREQTDKIDINQLKEYAKDTLYNEKVFQLLDQLGNKNSTAK